MIGSRREARAAIAAAVVAAAAGAALAQTPCAGFDGPERLRPGREAYALAVADFDLDGLPDLASLHQDFVAIALSRPAGFEEPIVHPADVAYATLAAGDFTNDGKPDVIVADFFPQLLLFVGEGDGRLQDPVQVGYLGGVSQLRAADVDGDGALDLVAIAYSSPSSLIVVRGHGDGTFDEPTSVQIYSSATSFDLADVDGDGRLDAVVAGSGDQSVALLSGTAQATFTDPVVLAAATSERAARFADVNGDGTLDIVTAEGALEPGFIDVRLGRVGGVFDPPLRSPAALYPVAIEPVDLDGDGIPDLAVLAPHPIISTSGGLEIFHGVGDGTFLQALAYVSGGAYAALASADFDGDGAADLAVGAVQPGENWIMRGRGDGTVRGVPSILFGSSYWYLVAGDFAEDGRDDVAAVGSDYPSSVQSLGVATAVPGRRFEEHPGGVVPAFPYALTAGDFHGTGHLDLLLPTFDPNGSALAIFPGHGDGTFGAVEQQTLGTPPSQSLFVAPGRFDSDSSLDLAVAGTNVSNGFGFVTVLMGNGDGTFLPGPTTSLPIALGSIAASDLDGDGNLDLVALSSGRFYVFLGNGDGSFSVSAHYTTGTFPTAIVLGDVDGDHVPDVVIGDWSSSSVLVYPGLGGGVFAAPHGIGVGSIPFSVELADFDGDGSLDIVCAVNPQKVALLLNYGDGTFVAPKTFVGMGGPAVVGDFDGDGFPDVAVSGASSGGVAILWSSRVSSVDVPVPPPAIVGSAANLVAQAGPSALTYQWRRGGVPLSDGGSISGSQTATLTIAPVSFADAGSYDAVVTDSCGTITSSAVSLSVEFADVPLSSPFHDDIVAIATAGISGGCGGGNYCPTSVVRRDQMAVFLLKSEHGSSYTPPPCAGLFADVPCPSPFADWVEQLAAEGVTGGCGGGNYCPAGSVTRAQMAVFLLKTSQGSSYTPPAAAGIFGDVPVGSFAADFIEDLYGRGITGGCQTSPLLYCPGSAVLRQQMATFLVRTFP